MLHKTTRVLLVDDDKMMLQVVSDMLNDLGIADITTALNGVAGIAAFDRMKQAPDVVLCDLNMPESDGFQLMEQLGSRHFAGGIILVSGMDERTMNSATLMARFHRLKFVATISKPVEAAALQAALAKLA